MSIISNPFFFKSKFLKRDKEQIKYSYLSGGSPYFTIWVFYYTKSNFGWFVDHYIHLDKPLNQDQIEHELAEHYYSIKPITTNEVLIALL